MPVKIEDILKLYKHDPSNVQRISYIKTPRPIAITEPDPTWPEKYALLQQDILSALGPIVVSIAHVGSTSVPGLPAKDIIDIDLTVQDVTDEAAYVGRLESAGWQFTIREPAWDQHRLFARSEPVCGNLHVWGQDSPEAERHRIFRDWLRGNEADRELYCKAKRDAAEQTVLAGGSVMDYTHRKEQVIKEILARAFRNLGYIQ